MVISVLFIVSFIKQLNWHSAYIIAPFWHRIFKKPLTLGNFIFLTFLCKSTNPRTSTCFCTVFIDRVFWNTYLCSWPVSLAKDAVSGILKHEYRWQTHTHTHKIQKLWTTVTSNMCGCAFPAYTWIFSVLSVWNKYWNMQLGTVSIYSSDMAGLSLPTSTSKSQLNLISQLNLFNKP